jgi:hypothetical protein
MGLRAEVVVPVLREADLHPLLSLRTLRNSARRM